MQHGRGCQCGLLLPVLLGGAAPKGFEAVVVAGFVGEDVDHHVDKVKADPGRTLVESLEVDEDHVPCEHLARRLCGRCGHLVGQRLALGCELLLPCDRLVAPHRISSLKSPPSARFPSPSYNLLLSMISRTPSGTRYLILLPCNILRLIPVAEISTRVHSIGKILSKFLKAASRWSSLERS